MISKMLIRTLTVAAGPSRGAICNPEKFGMCGSTYNLTLSHDPGQQYVLVADGTNHRIDAIATDSPGNISTGEVNSGKRAQKFVLKNGDGVCRFRPLNY